MACNCNEEGKIINIGMGCCVPVVANADAYYTKSEIDEKLDEIVTLAINSGVDILLFSNNLNYHDKNIFKKIHKIIKKEIKKGNIKEETIDESYNKIIELKKRL